MKPADQLRLAFRKIKRNAIGFRDGQTITIDSGANSETAVVASIRRFGATAITVVYGTS